MKPIQTIEEAIIGELIYNGKISVLKANNIISETDFTDPACSVLFAVCSALVGQRKEVNELTINKYLHDNEDWLKPHFARLPKPGIEKNSVDELSFRATELSIMRGKLYGHFDLQTHCCILVEEGLRRKAVGLFHALNDKLNGDGDIFQFLDNATKELMTLSSRSTNLRAYKTIEDAFDEAIKETKDELAGKIVRLPTGFAGLDDIIFGLEKGRLYCIAAEEKVGKSLLSYQVGLHIAKRGKPVAIVSLEMRASEIAKRYAGVHSGQAAQERLTTLLNQQREIADAPLYVRDGSADQAKVLTLAHRLHEEKQIELLIVDYLQLVELEGNDRVNDINGFVSRLKGLAMDLQIPVVIIAAVLNKQIHGRSDRKPMPSDIRDTGRLANDADCMMFLWKPDESDESYLELFVARSRYSPLGEIGLQLDKNTLRMDETGLKMVKSPTQNGTNFKGKHGRMDKASS